jgi:hypothetical protein
MISTFEQLLVAATEQDEPQRLLLLFAKAESDTIKKKDEQHGTLSPVMCVDKLPEEISSFKALSEEADAISTEWDFVITIGLSGKDGITPSTEDAEPFLNQMTNNLTSGQDLSQYVIFDRQENPVLIQVA